MGNTRQKRRLFASAYLSLRPRMILPRGWHGSIPYPFNNPSLHYCYLARNGIYALAQHWQLADQEVLFPAYFHGVELEALLEAGAQLRFYPVRSGMRVEFEDVLSRISPKTRAIYLIHYLGFPGPAEQLSALCRERGLLLIEDCALALLSQPEARPLGSYGDAAIFCFYKTLPLPNGGALLIQHSECSGLLSCRPASCASTMAYIASSLSRTFKFQGGTRIHRLLGRMRDLGKSITSTIGVAEVGTNHFDRSHVDIAMSRLSHWILAAQDFPNIIELRRRNFLHLLNRLREVSSPIFKELPPGVCPLFYPIQTRNKLLTRGRLFERGIETVSFWSQHHPRLPPGIFPEVDQLRRTVLEIPCHQDLTPEVIDWIADEVCELRRELR
jgi:perosamine synthetase